MVGTGGANRDGGRDGYRRCVCNGATGAAFPPITDYTARDGGFGPAVVTRNTGDAALGTDKVAVFRPAAAKYGQGGVSHPIIVWGNGSTNTVDIWQSFLSRVATYGFVVVAPEQTQVTAAQMNAAIDYALRLANDPTGGDCGKIDTTKIGSTGYSLGGIWRDLGRSRRSYHVHVHLCLERQRQEPQGSVGRRRRRRGHDVQLDAISTAVTGSTQPAFGAALAGIDHNRVAGQPKAQEAYIGWMRWRFMGDQAGHDMFVGASCSICTNTAFSAFVKTADVRFALTSGRRAAADLLGGQRAAPDGDVVEIAVQQAAGHVPASEIERRIAGRMSDGRVLWSATAPSR